MMGLTKRIRTSAGRYSEYRRIVGEIEALSKREADDIGISRHDAHRIAQQAVYGC